VAKATLLKRSKEKTDKSKAVEKTHSNDGVALATIHFIKWKEWQHNNERGGNWKGKAFITKNGGKLTPFQGWEGHKSSPFGS
jgi:hypothetical protein